MLAGTACLPPFAACWHERATGSGGTKAEQQHAREQRERAAFGHTASHLCVHHVRGHVYAPRPTTSGGVLSQPSREEVNWWWCRCRVSRYCVSRVSLEAERCYGAFVAPSLASHTCYTPHTLAVLTPQQAARGVILACWPGGRPQPTRCEVCTSGADGMSCCCHHMRLQRACRRRHGRNTPPAEFDLACCHLACASGTTQHIA
jgi:hypothetical protein